ncbi:methyltransferase domain-containing protein [Leifsonia sp. F6_8S_P_1B]|uniref:Methyltransferase domain-containing protein n=1 Tax=Leifsonia williamsii TaxID=3035919 RepID=A0ABT8KF01_9MICO|nr:methyltransferase domain-containing protein [Leifsonia williamsii]MDN4615598.1 methyltransferase domain-containing protein [Leifsonia williamsii]
MPALPADRLSRLASWLRCPVCGEDLSPVDRLTLGCENGHRHDVNKRGYVSLLGGGSKLAGDTAEMLDARDAVLESGVYSPIAEAVAARAVAAHAETPVERVLDAGAGTGYYLRSTLTALPDADGLAMDLSPAAVARAARPSGAAEGRIDGLVADTWRPLPIRSALCDVVLDVFAPRNLPEFHRVLRPGGSLIVVVPRADHLAELRAAGTMLDVPGDKAEELIAASAPLYALQTREHVAADLHLTTEVRAALIAMGPSAHHAASRAAEDAASITATELPDTTHLSVDVLHLSARP